MKNFTLSKKFIFLIILFVVAAFLRFYKLGAVPNSMNADESAIGYNAYSILKTGRDEYGRKFPLLFQSFDDYKMPAYVYLTVPSVAAFGLNSLAVRLPSAVAGTAAVIATYFLVELLFGNQILSFLAGMLLAISPWHLQFSRSAYEANLAVFFAVAGVVLILRGLRTKRYVIPGCIALALSVWSYHSSLIFIPLLCLVFLIIYFHEIKKNLGIFFGGFVVMFLICLPLLLLTLSPEGLVRARGVSALNNEESIQRYQNWLQLDKSLHVPFSNIIDNRRLVNFSIILQGYLEHYNPNFFFSEIVQGKYHAPGVGLMYLWELPFLFYGMHELAKRKEKGKYLIFAWFFFAPIAAAPTINLPHAVRALIFLPTLQIFVAFAVYGAYVGIERLHKNYVRALVIVWGVIVIINFTYYLHQYYVHMDVDYAKDWQYGYAQLVAKVNQLQGNYKKVIVSTSLDVPYMFFLYNLKYDPATYLSEGGTRSGKFDEESNRFGKYEFHKYFSAQAVAQADTLYVGTPKEVLPETTILTIISYPDGTQEFIVSAK